MSEQRSVGVVKFWNDAKGWGAIASDVLPTGRDVWVIGSKVEGDGYHALAAGQAVEFTFHAQRYESFDYIADFVRVLPEPDH